MRTKFAEFRSTINSRENSPKFYNETSAIIPLQTLVNEISCFRTGESSTYGYFRALMHRGNTSIKRGCCFFFQGLRTAQPLKFKFFLLRIIYFHFRDAFVNPAHRFKRITTEGQRMLTSIFMAHFSDPLNQAELDCRCINKLRFHYPGNYQRIVTSYVLV